MKSATAARRFDLRRRVFFLLDPGSTTEPAASAVHHILVALVIASVAAVVLATVPDLVMHYGELFTTIEIVAVTAFSLEYGLRLWSAPEYGPYAQLGEWGARWAFARSPSAVIDLLSIAPFCLALVVPADLRILVMLRLMRFFKLARYSPGMRTLIAVLEA
jgi:voltage-gated potassium channel